MPEPRFSICIPNYNYAHYLDETLRGIVEQDFNHLEVCISDNASTDASLDVIKAFQDDRFHVTVNQWNVGFAGNLDKAAQNACGQFQLMLSSDDLIHRHALDVYNRLLDTFSKIEQVRTVLVSRAAMVDSEGKKIGTIGRDEKLWKDAVLDNALSSIAGADVYSVSTQALLKRSMLFMRNPLPFLATCYARSAWRAVEGYGGGRLMNPDKNFAWKLLTVTDRVLFVDDELFSYRWHAGNQTAQQAKTATLKHLVDEYLYTFDTAPATLEHAGLSREALVSAFVEQDIALRNLQRVANGERQLARRGLMFGRAAYPAETSRSAMVRLLRVALALGPVGEAVAKVASGPAKKLWDRRLGAKKSRVL